MFLKEMSVCDVLMTTGLCIDLESFILVSYVTTDRFISLKEIGSFCHVCCHLLDIQAFISMLMTGFIKYCTQKRHNKLPCFKV